jgi:hypothetical protein
VGAFVEDSWLGRDNGLATAFVGDLDNRPELAAELGLSRDSGQDDPARLVISASRRWGDEFPTRLRGPGRWVGSETGSTCAAPRVAGGGSRSSTRSTVVPRSASRPMRSARRATAFVSADLSPTSTFGFDDHYLAAADYPALRRWILDSEYRVEGVDYKLLAECVNGEQMDVHELSWANDLARIHAFVSLWA